MSVSDPLVKDIKGCVQQFINLIDTNTPITDNNFYFVLFTQTIEKIFNKGLIRQQNTKFFERTIDAFSWLVGVAKECQNFTYANCVDQVRDRVEVSTNCGKLRLLIKYCLARKCLHIPIEALVRSHHAHVFYSPNSILGDEILTEIFLSVLRQVSRINFKLSLDNASFLDVSWYIPEVDDFELVPCRSLGIAVSFSDNKAVIVNVEPDGVAAENGIIKMGDILDQLNNIHINKASKGRLSLIMKCNKLKPVKIRIVKAYSRESGELYGPIQNLLRNLKIDLESVRQQYQINGGDISNSKKPSVYGYQVKYLAKVDVGSLGNVKQVQKAIKNAMDARAQETQSVKRINTLASLEIGEIGLKIRDKESATLILDHPYMKISSCGNIPICPKVFGYCAGEETCDIAKHFNCHIFEAFSLDDADLILQSIGQGFHRTHYAV